MRISAFSSLSSALETAVASSTRALDMPDVPLIIRSIKFAINIVLDLIIISRVHVGSHVPTVNDQATIQLCCNLASAIAGLAYFLIVTSSRHAAETEDNTRLASPRPTIAALKALLRPGLLTFLESLARNVLYLWQVAGIVSLGTTYATAWGAFDTIRWGLVMVPVQALEATSLAFVGHAWGAFRATVGPLTRRPRASRRDLQSIATPAVRSLVLALLIEIPLAIILSRAGCRPYAYWLGGNADVANTTAKIWRAIGWCYVFYAMSTQLATVLLATRPSWYLYQSLASNLLYILPWAFVSGCASKGGGCVDISTACVWGEFGVQLRGCGGG